MGVTQTLQETGTLEWGWDLRLAQREIPGRGGRLRSTLCLEDELKGGEKIVLVVSEGVAAVGKGLTQLLIAYDTAGVPAPGKTRQEGEGEETQVQVRMWREVEKIKKGEWGKRQVEV